MYYGSEYFDCVTTAMRAVQDMSTNVSVASSY